MMIDQALMDIAYREALGLKPMDPLPNKIGMVTRSSRKRRPRVTAVLR